MEREQEHILLVKDKEMWYVINNFHWDELNDILEDGFVGGANYTLEEKEVESFVDTHFCLVVDLSNKLIYPNGVYYPEAPYGWILVNDYSKFKEQRSRFREKMEELKIQQEVNEELLGKNKDIRIVPLDQCSDKIKEEFKRKLEKGEFVMLAVPPKDYSPIVIDEETAKNIGLLDNKKVKNKKSDSNVVKS